MGEEIAREIEESAWNYGYASAYHSHSKETNPFYSNVDEHKDWIDGHNHGLEDMKTDSLATK